MKQMVYLLVGILVFGSIWGFAEATLGAFLHIVNSPNKGEIMTSFGIMVMSAAAVVYRPKKMLLFMLGLGGVASVIKGLDLLFLPLDSHVLRVMVVIPVEALSFGLFASAFSSAFHGSRTARPLVGALSAYGSFLLLSAVYIYGGIGSDFWVGKGFEDLLRFTLTNGTIAAVLALVTTDIGYNTGRSLKPVIDNLIEKKTGHYYALTLIVSALLTLLRITVA